MNYASLRVVVLCHYGRTGYNVLRALGSIGAKVFVVIDRRSASLRHSRKCVVIQQVESIDSADPELVADQINTLHKAQFVDCVMACDVESLRLLSRMQPILLPRTFPMAPIPTIELLNDKWEFYKLCVDVDVRVPRTIFFPEASAIDPSRIATEIGFPAVLKPSRGYGQRGIHFLSSIGDVDRAMRLSSDAGGLVVQQFVKGNDWAISIFATEGHITHWTAWECPGQMEKSLGVSRFLITRFVPREDLFEQVAAIVAATEFSGVANFDARLDDVDSTMKMFECNPRFFGRLCAARLCGLDFVKAGLPMEDRQAFSIREGFYYPWQHLGTACGWKNMVTGRWKLGHLLQDMREMLADPIPPVIRKLSHEDALR